MFHWKQCMILKIKFDKKKLKQIYQKRYHEHRVCKKFSKKYNFLTQFQYALI